MKKGRLNKLSEKDQAVLTNNFYVLLDRYEIALANNVQRALENLQEMFEKLGPLARRNLTLERERRVRVLQFKKFASFIPGIELPTSHHVIAKWLAGQKKASLLNALADHGCEGSCPSCRIGEVEHHKCNKCGFEFCPRCHGTILLYHSKNVKECNCHSRKVRKKKLI